MKPFLLFLYLALLLTCYSSAQAAAAKPSAPGQTAGSSSVDPKLHADAITLVEISGIKQRIQDNLNKTVAAGRKQMMETCQRCTAEFGDEWEKRFLNRTNINDYVEVYVRVYEKYFTDGEISELIALQNAKKESATASLSSALKEKLTSVMPSVMSEIMGGCAQVGAKLGAEIGMEVEREHPEYIKPPSESDKH